MKHCTCATTNSRHYHFCSLAAKPDSFETAFAKLCINAERMDRELNDDLNQPEVTPCE